MSDEEVCSCGHVMRLHAHMSGCSECSCAPRGKRVRAFPRVHVKYFRNALNHRIWNSRVLEYEDQPYWERPYLTGDFGEIDYQLIYKRFAARYPELAKQDPAPFYDPDNKTRFTREQARCITKLLQWAPRVSENQLP